MFDAFGTLVHPVPYNGPYRSVLSAAPDFRRARELALTSDLSLSGLAAALSLPPITEGQEAALSEEVKALQLFDDVLPVLDQLHASNVTIAICSNLASAYGPAVVRLLPGVEHFVFSYAVDSMKPRPAIYDAVTKRTGVSASRSLFVGDTPKADFEGPRKFGMHAELLSRRDGDTLASCLMRAQSKLQAREPA